MQNDSQKRKTSRKLSMISSNNQYTEDDSQSIRSSRGPSKVGFMNPTYTQLDQERLLETYKAAKKRRSRGTIVQRATEKVTERMIETQRNNKETHIIDRISRYVFPLTFAVGNIIYFSYYLTRYHHHKDE